MLELTGRISRANRLTGSTAGVGFMSGQIHGIRGPKGDKGDTGNGISSVVLNADYTLTISFTDGTSYTTPNSIRGEKGDKGNKGDTGSQGIQGETGATGATGNGIASAVLNSDYTLTLTFTDGTTYTTGSIRGAQGVQGETGADGYSPTASVSKSGSTATITITDKNGTTTAQIYDGAITSIIGTSPVSVTGSDENKTIGLEDSGVTAGTYDGGYSKNIFYIPTFTVDSKGRITSASEISKYLQIISSSVEVGLMTRTLFDTTIKAPANWYDFGSEHYYSPKFLYAGDTTGTWTVDDPSAVYSNTNIGIFDVIARDKVTGEEVIVDWVSGITSGRNTLTVTIAEAYAHDIVIFPLTTRVIYGM